MSVRVVHCVNQFFAGIGAEEHAGLEPQVSAGPLGPGRLLEQLDPDLRVVATVAFGDDWFAADPDRGTDAVLAQVQAWIDQHPDERPDVVVTGPAFAAGRYGMACGAIAAAAPERLGVPAVTAMHPDNPAVALYRRHVPILATGTDVMAMGDAAERLVAAARTLAAGDALDPDVDGVLPRGLRRNVVVERTGAERAVSMLLAKVAGEPFRTELPMPRFERVPPAAPVVELPGALVAVVTSGGIVPRGNPDRIEAASASRFGEYPLVGLTELSAATHESVHGGYDPTFANADPNRVLPVDALRDAEREGAIGSLLDRYFATVGNGTSVEQAVRFGEEIAARLVNEGVQAVVLTST